MNWSEEVPQCYWFLVWITIYILAFYHRALSPLRVLLGPNASDFSILAFSSASASLIERSID
jgi:hypothetical protein